MKISNETKIGVLTAVVITVLILGYSYLSGNDVFSRSNKYYAIYNSVDGLSVSKPVLVNGFQIGRVSSMHLRADGRTVVEFKIDPQYNVPSSTLAQLISTDLLGGKAISFEYGDSKQFAQDKDTLRADIQGSLAESLQPIQMKAERLISKLDSSLAAVNKILNPDFQKNVDRSFNSIANSLQTLEGTTKKIDALVGGQTTHINNIMSNAEVVSDNLKTSTGHLTTVSTNFEKVSDDLANSNIKQTLDNANKTLTDLQATMSKINNGNGSLGLLINDDKMYKNLSDATANLNNLFIDIKAHPKRYVSFSVFGGKKN
ncbi:phospholipid/cholesterol/gamma-HCH transport system substrate-binding protein [Mucilaginibacter mallensis]|uniref:Phospholipid/cholesterol/gamma-HCH transport system substrate-binding protein n=1 Tax=Mucilaginibacter mallensis TaxID=652787 RepID=A0A1H1WIS5_MUCMA|nr:MlaD family protein [Mucilaginibacter mallensis]SDS96216.1 phospholipid/cholesterol/gamma-HCH transport system substrate-binding protein [Mucilaginibacter mallensis]